VQDPHLVKHDPKMPRFRWVGAADEHGYTQEAKDVAAFLVQNSLDPNEFPEYAALAQAPAGGSAGRGKELFEKKGCLACHAVNGAEGKRTGGTFASNLTDVGDKLTYEYAYRWIRAPRHRIVPWSVRLKKDLTEAEAKAEDPRTLVRRQPTRMPDLRLSDEEARDVASYLVSLKSGKSYPAAPWLADTSKDANGKTAFDRGRDLVVYSGCAGCHEIRGLESERGIGTELTKEGSKPLDRLDFGHLTTAAKRGHEPLADWASADGVKIFAPEEGHGDGGHHGWYRPRGFFMHKLAKPDLFDTSKYFADRFLRARMPQFDLKAQEIHDLTTFLLGSVETRIPEGSRYRPDETGQAIRDGWWIVKRYNCEGCHPVEPGNVPSFRTLPWWTTDTIGDMNFPPTLVGAGFRIRPDWMAKFLHDPSMGGGTDRPTALRRHLEVRMPSFSFTEEEVAKLVRFFDAMSKQPFVYQPPAVAALSDKEKRLAEKIWSKDGMNCMQCHLSSGPDGKEKPDSETKAPHFGYAKERLKPEWMRRWIPNPPAMQPTTKMTNDFLREKPDDPHSRWIYKTVFPEGDGVTADHVDLMIRYLFTLPEAK
jgi:mono/diheme cytochrome c family protein